QLQAAQSAVAITKGTGTAADQLAVMDGSASNLVTAAGTGFKLDPQAAATLIKGCDDALDELNVARMHASDLDNPPQLGTLSGAQTVSTFTHNVATDSQGIGPALESLQGTILQMKQAYIKASTNYQETEQAIADMMKQQAGGLNGGSATTNAPSTFQA